MKHFELHPQLDEDTLFIHDLAISQVRLMDDRRFPWLILVPRIHTAKEFTDLNEANSMEVLREIRQVSEIISQWSVPDKINIAMLGNLVPQLHIHIVARKLNDAAWPGPVWGVPGRVRYNMRDRMQAERTLKSSFNWTS